MQMGIAFVPGTFPTSKVADYLFDNYYMGSGRAFDFSNQMIDNIWYWYKEGIEKKGLAPYGAGATGIKDFLLKNTAYTERQITLWLMAVKSLAETGKIDPFYYSVKNPSTSPTSRIKDSAGAAFKMPAEILQNIKWIGLIGLAGVALYMAWPYIYKMRKKH